jgi:hypothetical protein
VELICEVLKALFNLTVNPGEHSSAGTEEDVFLRLPSILHDLLLCAAQPHEKQYELQRYLVYFSHNTY